MEADFGDVCFVPQAISWKLHRLLGRRGYLVMCAGTAQWPHRLILFFRND
jgi:hypothetical protein